MKQKKRTTDEIIKFLRDCEQSPLSQEQFAKTHNLAPSTICRWKKKFGLMDVNEAKRLRSLEKENAELKRMYADAMLGMKALKMALEKKL